MKSLGHVARANRLGRKLTKSVPAAQALVDRFPEFAGDAELEQLAADGPGRLQEVTAYVHGERPRELVDKDGVNDWFSAWLRRYGQFVNAGTDGWIGMNPFKTADLLLLGERGTATITEVRDTGTTINDDPRVDLRFHVKPERGAAFEANRRLVVSRLAVPQRGAEFLVVFDPADRERITFRRADVKAAATAALAKSADDADPVARLERLAALHASGALTADEFKAAKQQILGG